MGDGLDKVRERADKPRARPRHRAPHPDATPAHRDRTVTAPKAPAPAGNALAALDRKDPAPPLVTDGVLLPAKPTKDAPTGTAQVPAAVPADQAEARPAPPPPRRRAAAPHVPRDLSRRRVRDEPVTAHVSGRGRRSAWREGAKPIGRTGLTRETGPKDLPYAPVVGALPCEASIKDWLADDAIDSAQRTWRLIMIFHPLVSPYREVLKTRLAADSRSDDLAHQFYTKLAPATRKMLLSLLEGPPRPLSEIDPAGSQAFVADLKPENIHADPEPVFDPETIRVGEEPALVIDSVELPAATAAITIAGSSPPGFVIWSIRDGQGRELVREQRKWTGDRSEPLRLAFPAVGTYEITARFVETEGLLAAAVSRSIFVGRSELDLLRALPDQRLKEKWLELRTAMFENKLPDGLDQTGVQLKLSAIEWVAAERKLVVRDRPVADVKGLDKGVVELITITDGLVLAETPQKIRYQLESWVTLNGTKSLPFLFWRLGIAVDLLERWTRGSDAALREQALVPYQRIHWGVEQYAAMVAYDKEYIGWFEAAAWGILDKTLATSLAGASAARKAYGVPEPYRMDTDAEKAQQKKARAELLVVTGEMSTAKAALEAAEDAYTNACRSRYAAGGGEPHDAARSRYEWYIAQLDDPSSYVFSGDQAFERDWAIESKKLVGPIAAARDAEQKKYNALFDQRMQRYPILGAYRDANAADFGKLTEDTIVTDLIDKTYAVDQNIAKVKDHLHGHAYDLWKLDNVVHQTMAALHVAPNSLEAKVVEEKIEDAEPWWKTALIWIGVGLALAAAPFTAGSSIAIAIELASLAVTVVQLGVDIQEYRFGMAAAHTDLDQVRAVASTEPSLLPIIMDLAFAGLQVASVFKAFRAASKLRKLASAAEGVETAEAKALVKELDEVGQKALGRNIGTEIEEEALRVTKAKPYEEELAKVLEGRPGATLNAKVRPLDKDAFLAATGSESGNAVTVFKRNPATGKLEPEILVREGTDVKAIREEAVHLDQAADPTKAHLIEQLDEAKLSNWSNLTHEERMSSVQAKLELEIDAQKRILGELRAKPTLTDAEALQLDNAWQNIENLRGQFEEWGALENAGKATSKDAPILEQPARLFSKTTTTEFDALEIAAKDEKDFVKQYRDLHPSSRLTDEELIQRYADGKRINSESGFLHDPSRRAPRKADVPAKFKGTEQKFTTGKDLPAKDWKQMELSADAEAERKQLIAERDTARKDRDAFRAGKPPDETAAAKQGAKVNEASRKIGDLHANEYMKHFKDGKFKRIYPPSGAASRSGDFDQVWRRFKIVDGKEVFVDEIVIIEAKGGAGKLGVKNIGGQLHEQGTRDYYLAIKKNMAEIDAEAWEALEAGKSNTTYLLVHSPIESGAPSIADTIRVNEFDIGK